MVHREGQGVQGGTQDLEYTSFNLPSRVTGGDGTDIRYHYDAQRHRVSMTLGTGEHRVYAGSAYERQTTEDAAGPVIRHEYKVLAGARQIAQVERETRAGVTVETARRFIHTDRMGSSQVITDEQGRLVHVQRFDPWGKAITPANGSTDVATQNIRAGFTGHETDVETGLVNMRGRIYDPRLGRFMQADPILQSPFWSQGLNRYSYAVNNPFMYTDPSGFENDDEDQGGDDSEDDEDERPTSQHHPEKLDRAFEKATEQARDAGREELQVDREAFLRVQHEVNQGTSSGGDNAPQQAADKQQDQQPATAHIESSGESGQAAPDSDQSEGDLSSADDDFRDVTSAMAGDWFGPGAGNSTGGTATDSAGQPDAWAAPAPQSAAATLETVQQLEAAASSGSAAGPPGSPLCFAEGTKVLMADGTAIPIEEIREGGVVLADDPDDDKPMIARTVGVVHRSTTRRLFHLETEGERGGEIVATGGHPFWTQRGWVAAEELTTKDFLIDDRGQVVPIRSVEMEVRQVRTFNLSVDRTSTFFVIAGSTPVLVHNAGLFIGLSADAGLCAGLCAGSWAGSAGLYVGSEGFGVYGGAQGGAGLGGHLGYGVAGGVYTGSDPGGFGAGPEGYIGFGTIGYGSIMASAPGVPGTTYTIGGGAGGGFYVGGAASQTWVYGVSWSDFSTVWNSVQILGPRECP